MNVLVNATSARLGGGITVLRNLLPALLREDGGKHRYVVTARDEVRGQLDPGHERVSFWSSSIQGKTGPGRVFWEQSELPLRSFGKGDVLLSPANMAVLGSPVPQVLIFQNMAPFDPDVIARHSAAGRLRFHMLRDIGMMSAKRARQVV